MYCYSTTRQSRGFFSTPLPGKATDVRIRSTRSYVIGYSLCLQQLRSQGDKNRRVMENEAGGPCQRPLGVVPDDQWIDLKLIFQTIGDGLGLLF